MEHVVLPDPKPPITGVDACRVSPDGQSDLCN